MPITCHVLLLHYVTQSRKKCTTVIPYQFQTNACDIPSKMGSLFLHICTYLYYLYLHSSRQLMSLCGPNCDGHGGFSVRACRSRGSCQCRLIQPRKGCSDQQQREEQGNALSHAPPAGGQRRSAVEHFLNPWQLKLTKLLQRILGKECFDSCALSPSSSVICGAMRSNLAHNKNKRKNKSQKTHQ